MSIETRILMNLSERVTGVNGMIALHGIKDTKAGRRALDKLIEEGKIEVEQFRVPDTRVSLPLYRLGLGVRGTLKGPLLVVDNTEKGS